MSQVKETGRAAMGAGQGVSRPELEKLEAERRAAIPLRALTPPGLDHQSSPLQTRQREDRIRHIEARLDSARDRAVIDFALGQQRGVARAAFKRGDRER